MFIRIRSGSFYLSIILILILLSGCAKFKEQPVVNDSTQIPVDYVELTISAAASLTDALHEIQTVYEGKNTNIKLNFNFGASGALQQQIEQGAPADLFLSASTKYMETLVDKQLIDASQQINLLVNELVVVISTDGKVIVENIEDLVNEDIQHLAIGVPETVPAGNYAMEALTHVKLWDSLQGKIVQGKDVRQVLTYVETGNAEAGFVYNTDALTSKNVKVAFHVDPKTYSPIVYPIGIVKATKHSKEASDFYTYLESNEAQHVFAKFGFSTSK